jgi:dCMP deaminase
MEQFIRDWDTYFSLLAELGSLKSKDPKRKVGAVIVSDDRQVLSVGFNGSPRGLAEPPDGIEQTDKNLLVEHAERNAIYNAARYGIPLRGAILYVTWHPCSACSRAIIQAGIKELVICNGVPVKLSPFWENDIQTGRRMLEESGLTCRTFTRVCGISIIAKGPC